MINQKKFAETYVHFDKETVVEIIDIFFEEYGERIEKILHQLDTCDFVELQKSAHAFKGVIANFETECKAYEEISEIEIACRKLLETAISEKSSSAENGEQLAIRLKEIFNSFKRNSLKIYYQLKEIRKNYVD